MTEATEQVKEAKEVKAKVAKKIKITIHSDGDGGDKGDVILVHNYHQVQIMRNKEVEIDEKYLECLKGSMIQTLVKGDDDKMHPVTVPRYNYTLG